MYNNGVSHTTISRRWNKVRTGRFLFTLGVVVMVVEIIGFLINIIHSIAIHQFSLAGSAWISNLFGSFYQGGTLMGIGKILQTLLSKRER